MLPALLGTCSAAHHELPVKALPSQPEDVPTTPSTCIQNSVLQIRPCLSQLSEARLCRAVPCYAVLTTDFLFQVPLLAHESITEPAFDSATQALVFHLKCRWRTELHSSLSQNSPVQHCSPQMMGNFCLRPCLSAISNFFRTYALAKEKHATPPIAALQYCTSLVKAVPFSSTKALRHREG